MVVDFLNWSVSVLSTLVSWLSSMQIVTGVSLLGFLAACFVLGLLVRALIVKA